MEYDKSFKILDISDLKNIKTVTIINQDWNSNYFVLTPKEDKLLI